jgi:voltage-gated potassium channel
VIAQSSGQSVTDRWSRVWLGLAMVGLVTLIGTGGYMAFGYGLIDSIYQTVMTITTVGFGEVEPFDGERKLFTVWLMLFGVGTALYTFGVLLDTLVEGRVAQLFGRRRVQRHIDQLSDHVIVCGWGRVGRTIAQYVSNSGQAVVVVERDPSRADDLPHPTVLGDATDDDVLRAAGIMRARALIAALNTDADNLYVTLSGRGLCPGLFIVARARVASAEAKLTQAGADRVVNPQHIGGARMAAFTLQPHVTEFLDVVMHDGSLEFRLEEVALPAASPLAGLSIRDAHIRDQTGALVLALRHPDGAFTTNPSPDALLAAGQVLIAIGTSAQLSALADAASGRSDGAGARVAGR